MKEIKAKEGMYLTQVGEVTDRIFVAKVKGVTIREEDWRDATSEEKQDYERLMEDRYVNEEN